MRRVVTMCFPAVLGLLCGCAQKPAVKPKKVFLCRHCDYAPLTGSLTEKGRKQAARIAEKLKNEDIELVLHSPVKRCAETARIIRDKLKTPKIRSAEWLHEDSETAEDWDEKTGDGTILLVTHSPVISQITDKKGASTFGVVTRLK